MKDDMQIRVSKEHYQIAKKLAKEQQRNIKTIMGFALEAYAKVSKGWKIK